MKMLKMVQMLIDRLKEPSSWAGLAGIALLAGLSMDDFNLYVQAITGALAFMAIVMKEAA
jgi:hypothetical protein